MPIDWSRVFTRCSPEPPATRAHLDQLIDDLSRPPSPREVDEVLAKQSNPFPAADPLAASWKPVDPTSWRLPGGPLPPAYESFLLSSNGGRVETGRMELCFFSTRDLRDFMLRYHVPEYMPRAIPLGLDGAGNFALFDVRAPLDRGEYPVLLAAAGNLGFDDARLLSATFEGFCRRTEPVEDGFELPPLRPPPPAEVAEREARFAAQAAERDRRRALAGAETAFKSGDFARVIELLAPYRDALAGSIALKLRIAEKKRA